MDVDDSFFAEKCADEDLEKLELRFIEVSATIFSVPFRLGPSFALRRSAVYRSDQLSTLRWEATPGLVPPSQGDRATSQGGLHSPTAIPPFITPRSALPSGPPHADRPGTLRRQNGPLRLGAAVNRLAHQCQQFPSRRPEACAPHPARHAAATELCEQCSDEADDGVDSGIGECSCLTAATHVLEASSFVVPRQLCVPQQLKRFFLVCVCEL